VYVCVCVCVRVVVTFMAICNQDFSVEISKNEKIPVKKICAPHS